MVRVKSRTSRPRLTVIWRSALAWFQAEISRTPLAHSSGEMPELAGQGDDAGAGGVDVERDLATEQVGRDPAQGHVGVGDGDVGPALGVAERARVGACRVRADLEGALGGEPGDRAAAGADGDDVDHRDLARERPDAALGGQRGLAVDDDRDVGGGAAAVAGQDLVEARDLGDQRGAEGAGRGAGQDGGDRLVHDLLGGEHAAVGLHHVERHVPLDVGAGEGVQPGLDVADVARELRLHRGVDERRHRALVLAVLAQHLRGDADDGLGVLLAQDLAQPLLVLGVGVGVQQADAERVHAAVAEPPGGGAGALLVEGAHLRAGVVEAATDALDQVPRDDPVGLDPEVGVAVPVGHRLARDLEHRLVALGGDEAELVDLALEELVGGHRGAVADRGDRVAVVGGQTQQAEHLLHAGEEAVGRVARRRRRLGRDQLAAVLVEGDDVGERATRVDADPDETVLRHGLLLFWGKFPRGSRGPFHPGTRR